VFAIGLSFLGTIHHFWLRDAFRKETPPLDARGADERCESHSVLNESSSKAGCQAPWFSVQAPSRSKRNSHKPFDPGVTTFVGRKPKPQKKMLRQEKLPALSQTWVCGRS